jgi:hypothetical protein
LDPYDFSCQNLTGKKLKKRYKDKPVEASIEIVFSLIALILALGGAIFLLFIALTPKEPPQQNGESKRTSETHF